MSDVRHFQAAAAAVRRQERAEQWWLASLTMPGLLLMLMALVLPLGWLVFMSFSGADGLTLVNYTRVLGDLSYLRSLQLTVVLACVVTVLAVLLGAILAFAIVLMQPAAQALCLALVAVPFWTSVLVRTYAWLVLLQNRGVVNKALMGAGVIDEPLRLMYNTFGAGVGMLHIMLPFMVFPLVAQMRQIDPAYMRAAIGLGAPIQVALRRVFLPLCLPGIMAGAVFVFVLSLGFYITPALLGGGRVMTIAMVIERDVSLNRDWGPAASVAVLFVLAILLLLGALRRLVPLERLTGPAPSP